MAPGPANQLLSEYASAASPVVTQVRGTLIVSSLQTLRELGYMDAYLARLPKVHREEVMLALATSWLPVDLAMAHYGACEAMGLGDEDLDAIGRHVAQRIMGTFLGTLMRSSRDLGGGASPVIPLRQYHRLWERLLVGGGCTVRTSGMKDAYIESRGVPMFRYRYFRIAYMGLIRGAGLLFAKAVYTRIRTASNDTLCIDASWV